MTGRIETYMHSDSITENKGGAIVKVECQTDFAARTDGFKTFAQVVAKLAYGANAETWSDLIKAFPEMETHRKTLEDGLRETVSISEIRIIKLDPLPIMASKVRKGEDEDYH